jgi:hypothetical protein
MMGILLKKRTIESEKAINRLIVIYDNRRSNDDGIGLGGMYKETGGYRMGEEYRGE